MPLTVEAIYENGVLKPAHPLPLKEHEEVRVTIVPKTAWVQELYGTCGWKGSAEEAERFASDPELDFPPPPEGAMIFTDLVVGGAVFVDANTLSYYFEPHPIWGPLCADLLQRIENGELHGFTSTHALSEVSHRLMTIQASALFGWPFTGIGNRLRSNPTEVQKLTAFRQVIDRILQSSLQVLTIAPLMLASAASLSQQLGMLTNDGLILAVMQANGLSKIASNDADFDRVPGITRYGPA
jgi:predicted nucleic acid-binding protein/predicted DNA-binding antitoxin AbrB/MazE fold protein